MLPGYIELKCSVTFRCIDSNFSQIASAKVRSCALIILQNNLDSITMMKMPIHADRAQKLMRPLSPHLQIYRPQLTSVLSFSHRLSGIAMGMCAVVLVALLIAAASPKAATHLLLSANEWFTRGATPRSIFIGLRAHSFSARGGKQKPAIWRHFSVYISDLSESPYDDPCTCASDCIQKSLNS